jgi:murein L,D-transpeptidase YafK
MKGLVCFLLFSVFVILSFAQPSFVDYQKTYPRVAAALRVKEDTLKKQFEKAGLQWPAKQLYIRSFKYDSQLEVWVRNTNDQAFKLFKTYKVCALAGSMGPKRLEGDYQVPEGFYYINEFNPNSHYHLSLGINYPNASDKVLSDSLKPGGDIYIHGSCLTVGCIPIQDSQIEELYILAAMSKASGQDFIPVHIFPVRYNNRKSFDYFSRTTKDNQDLQRFAIKIKEVYDYFEQKKKLPLISVNKKGDYVVMM